MAVFLNELHQEGSALAACAAGMFRKCFISTSSTKFAPKYVELLYNLSLLSSRPAPRAIASLQLPY